MFRVGRLLLDSSARGSDRQLERELGARQRRGGSGQGLQAGNDLLLGGGAEIAAGAKQADGIDHGRIVRGRGQGGKVEDDGGGGRRRRGVDRIIERVGDGDGG